jgi:hypothetical protein
MEDKLLRWDDIVETKYINQEGTFTLKIVEVVKDENGNVTQETANGKEFHKYICETIDKERINATFYLTKSAMWKYREFVCAVNGGVKPAGDINYDTLPLSLLDKKFVGEVTRCADKLNVATGEYEKSKYFEISKFYPFKG